MGRSRDPHRIDRRRIPPPYASDHSSHSPSARRKRRPADCGGSVASLPVTLPRRRWAKAVPVPLPICPTLTGRTPQPRPTRQRYGCVRSPPTWRPRPASTNSSGSRSPSSYHGLRNYPSRPRGRRPRAVGELWRDRHRETGAGQVHLAMSTEDVDGPVERVGRYAPRRCRDRSRPTAGTRPFRRTGTVAASNRSSQLVTDRLRR